MFLKNKNIIFKFRRSKVTDYAALTVFWEAVTYICDGTYASTCSCCRVGVSRCYVSVPLGAVGWSVVYDCEISCS